MWGQDIELQLQRDHEQQQRRQQQLEQQRYQDEDVSELHDDFESYQGGEHEGAEAEVGVAPKEGGEDEAVEVDITGLLSMAGLFERADTQTDEDTIPPPPPSSYGGDFAEERQNNSRRLHGSGDDDDGYPTKENGGRRLKTIIMLLCLAMLFAAIGLAVALTKGKRDNKKSGTGTPSATDDPTANQLSSTESSVVSTTDPNAPPPECGEVLTVDTTCFAPVGGSIEIFFTECGTVESLDWIGLYPNSIDLDDPDGLGDDYLLWVYACDNTEDEESDNVDCQPSLVIEFASGSQIPLGTYRLAYFKNNQLSAPYTSSSYSQEIHISENCQ